jgi:hypothetical protein
VCRFTRLLGKGNSQPHSRVSTYIGQTITVRVSREQCSSQELSSRRIPARVLSHTALDHAVLLCAVQVGWRVACCFGRAPSYSGVRSLQSRDCFVTNLLWFPLAQCTKIGNYRSREKWYSLVHQNLPLLYKKHVRSTINYLQPGY